MERRKAIATAGAVTAAATAAVIAFGANFGIFGLTQNDSNVGKFPAVSATSTAPATTTPTSSPRDDSHIRRGQNDDHGSGHDDD